MQEQQWGDWESLRSSLTELLRKQKSMAVELSILQLRVFGNLDRSGYTGGITLTESEAYRVLGLPENTGPEHIRTRYRELIVQVHPDKVRRRSAQSSDWPCRESETDSQEHQSAPFTTPHDARIINQAYNLLQRSWRKTRNFLAQQFIDVRSSLDELAKAVTIGDSSAGRSTDRIWFLPAMLEYGSRSSHTGRELPKTGDLLYPSELRHRRLFLKDVSGEERGWKGGVCSGDRQGSA